MSKEVPGPQYQGHMICFWTKLFGYIKNTECVEYKETNDNPASKDLRRSMTIH